MCASITMATAVQFREIDYQVHCNPFQIAACGVQVNLDLDVLSDACFIYNSLVNG